MITSREDFIADKDICEDYCSFCPHVFLLKVSIVKLYKLMLNSS